MRFEPDKVAMFKALDGSVALTVLYRGLFEMTEEEADEAYNELFRQQIYSEKEFFEYSRDKILAKRRAEDEGGKDASK